MNWATAPLSEIATIERNAISPADIVSGSRYVGLDHIESGGGSIRFGSVENGELASSKFRFGPNHILFGKLRPYLAKVACPDFAGICSTDIVPISPGKRVDKRYLLHFLRRPETIAWAAGRATGVNLPRLSPNELASLRIPLPPLDEQRRIAAILDKADALRCKRKRAIGLISDLPRSVFSEQFGKVNAFVAVAEVCSRVTDGTHQAPTWAPEGVPFLFVSNVRNQEICFDTNKFVSMSEYQRLTKSTPIEPGDVLYTAVGSYGNTAVVRDVRPFVFQRHIAHLKPNPDRISSAYLSFALEAEGAKRQADKVARGVAQLTVTLDSLKKMLIPLPRMEDQRRFEAFVSLVNVRRTELAAGQVTFDKLFSSLQHRAFSGQL